MEQNSKMLYLMSSALIKVSPDSIQLQELHNKMELLNKKNRTLVEAARTMFEWSKTTPVFLGWGSKHSLLYSESNPDQQISQQDLYMRLWPTRNQQ